MRPFGFSLVEVAVSMGVLSVSCVGLLGLLASCFDQFRGTIDRSCVTAIAQNLVNQAQQADLDALQAAGPALRYFDDQARETQAGASSSVYRARLRVTTSASYPDNAPANPDLSRITVQVTSNHGPLPQTGAGGLWQDAPARRVLTEVALLGPQR